MPNIASSAQQPRTETPHDRIDFVRLPDGRIIYVEIHDAQPVGSR